MFDVTMAHAAAAATVATDAGVGGLILEKAGQYVLIIAFFGSIIWFLRFLYGPKGILRDPAWDRWNDQARREAEVSAQDADAQAQAAAPHKASPTVPPVGSRSARSAGAAAPSDGERR
ncbi:MAG: hypothetical protein LBU75_02715 [Desulfovibrio sp.]|nr:hypothetical protein [Desulfovibrio sp.]